jgi:ABC-type polysaccharide/polyol phosphate export permease
MIYGYIAGMRHLPSLMLIPALTIHLVIFSLMGIAVALKVKNHGDQFAVNAFIITPMIFLSGTFYPVEKMPIFVKYLAHIFPMTYTTSLIRGSVIGIETQYLLNFGVSALIAGLLFWLCLRIVKGMEP